LTVLAAGAPAQEPVDIDGIIAGLTLEQKVMQMHVVGFPGPAMNDEMRRLVQDACLGGIFVQVLENFVFPEECARLARSIQETALDGPHGIPLFIAMDQEGGIAAPLHFMFGATPTPGNMALGASGREEDTAAAYGAMGADLRACGVNVNFAPVIDLLLEPENPDYTVRCFGADPARNARLGAAAVKALQARGVVGCAKHFPGYIDYAEDTHSDLPYVNAPAEALPLDLWRAVTGAGADMIMTHHVVVTAWDRDNPVTLSRAAITGVLREQLGYDGLVITDSMGMGALKQAARDAGDATVRAVDAGCDIILQVARDFDELRERVEAVANAVRAGQLTAARIDQSLHRILRAKERLGLFSRDTLPAPDAVAEQLRGEGAVDANRRAALNGVVVVRDEAGLLPLRAGDRRVLVVCAPATIVRAGKGNDAIPAGYTLDHFIRQRLPEARVVHMDPTAPQAQVILAAQEAARADLVILGQMLAHQSPEQVRFIRALLLGETPVIIVGMGDPSDLALFPAAPTYVAAHSPAPISLEAAVQVLFGEAEPGGTLPMPIAGLYPLGHRVSVADAGESPESPTE
jgi:beta-N-acetylhexosaminidase